MKTGLCIEFVDHAPRVAFFQYAHGRQALRRGNLSNPQVVMPIATHDVSIALFVRGLTNLKTVLHKGEQYAATHGLVDAELLGAQLAPDMHSLAAQVHWAAEGAKLAAARLAGAAPELTRQEGTTFAELRQHLDATILNLRSFSPESLEAGLARSIEIEHPRGRMQFTGDRFLREFAIPTFFFHLTSAYAILRHLGVLLTKGDFLGSFD